MNDSGVEELSDKRRKRKSFVSSKLARFQRTTYFQGFHYCFSVSPYCVFLCHLPSEQPGSCLYFYRHLFVGACFFVLFLPAFLIG